MAGETHKIHVEFVILNEIPIHSLHTFEIGIHNVVRNIQSCADGLEGGVAHIRMGSCSVVVCGIKVVVAVALVALCVQHIAEGVWLVGVRGCLKAPFGGCRILAEAVGIFAVYGAVIPQWVVEVSKFKAFVINLVQCRCGLPGYSICTETFSGDKYHIVPLEHAGVFVRVSWLYPREICRQAFKLLVICLIVQTLEIYAFIDLRNIYRLVGLG